MHGVWLGLKLHYRIPQGLFYKISYASLFGMGTKLIWGGVSGGGWV